MSGEVFVQNSCPTTCGPLVLRLLCPTATTSNYQLVMSERIIFNRPADTTLIGGIDVCIDNPLYMGCANVIDFFTLYDGSSYITDHSDYISALEASGKNLDMTITDLNADGTLTGESVTFKPTFLVEPNGLNKNGFCPSFTRGTPSGSAYIDLSAFSGCKFAITFGSDYPLTTATGISFCKPPSGCATACNSVVVRPSFLAPINYAEGNSYTHLTPTAPNDTTDTKVPVTPTSNTGLAYTAASAIDGTPLDVNAFYTLVTPVFVSGTFQSNDPVNIPNQNGDVTNFQVIDPLTGEVSFKLNNDFTFTPGTVITATITLRLQEVGMPINVSSQRHDYVVSVIVL